MAEKSLQEFAASIRQYLDEGRVSDALPMAQHLLRQNPRYLPGYELLGEVALQQGSTRDAIELFRRVLSVDPESFVAHTGLAAAYNDEGVTDEALWHMTRAFELEPGNREVRQQLRQLFETRDGRAPGRLHLNRAALSRTYLRDGWYDRAIEELQSELRDEPDRVDVSAALVEAQWLSGRHHDAVRSAELLLQELPYCLKANIILGEFYAQEGDLESAERYLRIVQELDPEHEWAAEYFGDGSYLKPNRVPIQSLDEALGRTPFGQDGEQEPLPDWLDDLPMFRQGVDDNVNWDAITAYETDWRTILSRDTREAIENHRPDWRTELRRRTTLSLRERADEMPTPAFPQEAAPAIQPTALFDAGPSVVAPDTEPVESALAVTEPAEPVAEEVPTPEATAIADPHSETDWTPGSSQVTPAFTVSDGAWRLPLRAATLMALEEYDDWGTAPLESPQVPPHGGWRDQLAGSTVASLNETAEPADSTSVPEQERASSSPYWRELLDTETQTELEDYAGSVAPVTTASSSPWIESLRADTEPALAANVAPEADPATRESTWFPAAQADWVLRLRETTFPSEDSGRERDEDTRSLPEPTVSSVEMPTWVTALRAESVDLLAQQTGALSEPFGRGMATTASSPAWTQSLRVETALALEAKRPETPKGEHHGLAERLVDGASEVAHRVQDVASTLKRKATGALSSLFSRDQEIPRESSESSSSADSASDTASTSEAVADRDVTGGLDEQPSEIVPAGERESGMTSPDESSTLQADDSPADSPHDTSGETLDSSLADSGVTVVLDPEPSDNEATELTSESDSAKTGTLSLDRWQEPAAAGTTESEQDGAEWDSDEAATALPELEGPRAHAGADPGLVRDTIEQESGSDQNELAAARSAWERGESKEAFAIYQQLFFEGTVDDESLAEALRAWTVTGEAPALAHQLLGDIYRRLNRMPEALAEYREAIRRM